MTVLQDTQSSRSLYGVMSSACLEDKFEILKDIGDGSFGSVVLARVRSAGAHIARRGSFVAIKTMKKTFDSLSPCLELREVVFLRSLPVHAHLVPALDIFLDPLTKKLHICMEHMDGNLYQLMKSRDHKCLDGSSVKSILYQILSGLEHIHAHNFFHRDIKPENILVSSSATHEFGTTLRRYSALVTPPSTPPLYTIKIADFGLARESHSQNPYTAYVSTRWYRAPEVLLRAGEYSAPVDIWAFGAMAAEIANLKPLFPGGNEVDQVWRVCEIMGSPGNWYDKSGNKVGGGDWREGTRLAQKLGFSFPKMAPHYMETVLRPPQWPVALSKLVSWCLMWDPRNRPTSAEAMRHEYFIDAIDPLQPKSSNTRLLGKKYSGAESKSTKESGETPTLSSKPSWFRKSLVARESAPSVPQHTTKARSESSHAPLDNAKSVQTNANSDTPTANNVRLLANKRATWVHATVAGAPMPILPTIRPISPFSDAVTAQAHRRLASNSASHDLDSDLPTDNKSSKKIGRQLSIASNGNHYADLHRQETDRSMNGSRDPISPSGHQKESFFSHLRKRARRLSGRPQAPLSPNPDDVESNPGCGPWQSNRSSMILDSSNMDITIKKNPTDGEKSLPNGRHGTESLSSPNLVQVPRGIHPHSTNTISPTPSENQYSFSHGQTYGAADNTHLINANAGPISSRTRRALHMSTQPAKMYETPDEEDELLHEALHSTERAVKGMDRARKTEDEGPHNALANINQLRQQPSQQAMSKVSPNPYPTPTTSAKRNGLLFSQNLMREPITPLNISKGRANENNKAQWPTPPYEENEWAASAAASIFAAGSIYQ